MPQRPGSVKGIRGIAKDYFVPEPVDPAFRQEAGARCLSLASGIDGSDAMQFALRADGTPFRSLPVILPRSQVRARTPPERTSAPCERSAVHAGARGPARRRHSDRRGVSREDETGCRCPSTEIWPFTAGNDVGPGAGGQPAPGATAPP